MLQFLAFFLTLVTSVLHFIIFKVKGNKWCHEVFIREDAEEEE
jgi:hypothetical protein